MMACSLVAKRTLVASSDIMDGAVISPNTTPNHYPDELIDGAFNNYIESRDN